MFDYKIKIIKIKNLLDFSDKINKQASKGWRIYKRLIRINRKFSQTYVIIFKKK